MSSNLHVPNLRAGYLAVCRHVLAHGTKVKPRGRATREVLGVTVQVEDLSDTLPVGVNRGLSLEVAALEALQLIGEVSRPDLLVTAQPRFEEFRDPDGSLHGAYGLRVRGQTGRILERLRDDPASRQGVVTVWDHNRDSYAVHPDMPCTVVLQLLPRGDRLHLQVFMRSNDVWLGLAYDYFVFTQWLWTCARVLDLQPGTYTHHVGSLHLYEDDVERVEQLAVPTKPSPTLPLGLDVGTYPSQPRIGWDWARRLAVLLLDDPESDTVPGPNDWWYRERLITVHQRQRAQLRVQEDQS